MTDSRIAFVLLRKQIRAKQPHELLAVQGHALLLPTTHGGRFDVEEACDGGSTAQCIDQPLGFVRRGGLRSHARDSVAMPSILSIAIANISVIRLA
jgi:hypothetical protein